MDNQNTVKSKVKIGSTEEVEVPMHFVMSTFLPSVLAQHVTIQSTPESILIGFYEANPPIMFEPTPEAIEEFRLEGYTAECVSRITIPNSRFVEIAKLFSQVADGLKLKQEGEQDASTE
ncbi:MAG: hypothetical protein AB7P14_18980 [Blastocatellales bacterium]